MTKIFLTVSYPGHTIANFPPLHAAINAVQTILLEILRLLNLEGQALYDCYNRTKHSVKKNFVHVEVEVDPVLCEAPEIALKNLLTQVNAAAILSLPHEDNRRTPLTRINNVIAKNRIRLDVVVDDIPLLPVQNLAFAPPSKTDEDWGGDITIRVTSWVDKRTEIEGQTDDGTLVQIKMRKNSQRFHALKVKDKPFLHVLGGLGYRNEHLIKVMHFKDIVCCSGFERQSVLIP